MPLRVEPSINEDNGVDVTCCPSIIVRARGFGSSSPVPAVSGRAAEPDQVARPTGRSRVRLAIDGSKFKEVNNRDRNFTRAKVERRQAQIAGDSST